MILLQRLTAAFLIALAPLSAFSASSSESTETIENCDTILWSKASPNKALVIRHIDSNKTAFLTCSGHFNSEKKKHVMDSCRSIEPDRQFYTKDELMANWYYLIERSAKDNFAPVLTDTVTGFFVSTFAVGWIGQRLLAEGVASTGELLASMSPSAARAVSSTGKALGGGADLFEGSRAVANDQTLRFFPSYIGAANGVAWAGIKNIKNGDLNRSMQRASSMSPFGYRSYACGPQELHREFTSKGLRTPKIEEFEKTLRTALKMSRERPDSVAMTEKKKKEEAKRIAEKMADQSPPELAPAVEAKELK